MRLDTPCPLFFPQAWSFFFWIAAINGCQTQTAALSPEAAMHICLMLTLFSLFYALV